MISTRPAPTKVESIRMEMIKRSIGCIACRMDGVNCVPSDAHHILSGGIRKGHRYTIPLCRKHHDEVNSRAFHLRYGEELSLLRETNELIERYKSVA